MNAENKVVTNLYVSCDLSTKRENDVSDHLIKWKKVVTKNT